MSERPQGARYVILGAGGAGRTAAGILERMAALKGADLLVERAIAFLDDTLSGRDINGYSVVGGLADAATWLGDARTACVVAFGTRFLTQKQHVFERIRDTGAAFCSPVDPSVAFDRTARVGIGTVIAAQCVVNPNAAVGDNCFLCVATTVDHDSVLGNHVWCSPGVNVAGGVVIEDNVMLGTNATVMPGLRIGRGAVIGAGTVVRRDIPAAVTVVGNPARILAGGKS